MFYYYDKQIFIIRIRQNTTAKYCAKIRPDFWRPWGFHRRSSPRLLVALNRCERHRCHKDQQQLLHYRAKLGWPENTSMRLSTSWGAASGHSISLPNKPTIPATLRSTRLQEYFPISQGSEKEIAFSHGLFPFFSCIFLLHFFYKKSSVTF